MSLDPWAYVQKVRTPGEGVKHTVVECNFCGLNFTVASATRIEGHLVGDPKAGVKACPKIAELDPLVGKALKANFDEKTARRLEKKRSQEAASLVASPSQGQNKTPGSLVKATNARKKKKGGTNPYPPVDTARAATADLADVAFPDPIDITVPLKTQVIDPRTNLRDYGGLIRFFGQASTVKCFENNPLVRQALEENGTGRVLIVDGGASYRCALMGDNLAEMGHKNGWSGVIINGCIRDSDDISRMPLGVKALNTHPIKSSKRDVGLRDVPVSFGGVTITPGDWIYADKDGVLVSKDPITFD